ncbi:hypothetical protein HMPREF1547_02742 [Blautia sp. KLE 1732]|nr:hypothetical protein HMPREF1547_02742 [Blautia sp. KLE 1732]
MFNVCNSFLYDCFQADIKVCISAIGLLLFQTYDNIIPLSTKRRQHP